MTITFIIPFIGVGGGIKAVFEFANELKKLGHNVSVIYPLMAMPLGHKWYDIRNFASRVKKTIINYKNGPKVNWFNLRAKLVGVPNLAEKYIPKADIIVATWWETAYYVNKYNQDKGQKFYLVQHYEVWGGPKEKVDQSYKLGLKMIIHSTWLKNILENKLHLRVEDLILHAPDRNQFYLEDNFRKNKVRVLMPYRAETWKASNIGIEAFEKAKAKFLDIELVMYGLKYSDLVPKCAEFHLLPSLDELRNIYNSCDIFLFSSECEGFGMPPLEAMACKIPVITTNVGAVADYTIPGKTALVSEPGDVNSLAQNLISLIENPKLRQKIGNLGYEYTKHITWERAAIKIEKVFKKYIH